MRVSCKNLIPLIFNTLNYNQLNKKRSILVLVEEEGRGWKSRHCIIVSRLLINLFRCKRP